MKLYLLDFLCLWIILTPLFFTLKAIELEISTAAQSGVPCGKSGRILIEENLLVLGHGSIICELGQADTEDNCVNLTGARYYLDNGSRADHRSCQAVLAWLYPTN